MTPGQHPPKGARSAAACWLLVPPQEQEAREAEQYRRDHVFHAQPIPQSHFSAAAVAPAAPKGSRPTTPVPFKLRTEASAAAAVASGRCSSARGVAAKSAAGGSPSAREQGSRTPRWGGSIVTGH